MGKQRAKARAGADGGAPKDANAPNRSGQGAGSAMQEMQRRRMQNPPPAAAPSDREKAPRARGRRQGG